MNDLGAFVDRDGVREADFYGHTYPRLIELSARLEPLVLAVSASRGFRWGMRIRRMGVGARAYYAQSRLHSGQSFTIDSVVIVAAGRTNWLTRQWQRARLLAGRHAYTPTAERMAKSDVRDLAAALSALARFDERELRFLSHAV